MNRPKSKRDSWGRGLLAIAAALCLAHHGPVVAAAEDEVAKLLQERLTVLEQIAEMRREQFKQGLGGVNSAIDAERNLLDAKLELATTATERAAVLEDLLKNAKLLEEVSEARAAAGVGNAVEGLQAKAYRLKVQADLLREKRRARGGGK